MTFHSKNINLIDNFIRKGKIKKNIIIQVGSIIFAVTFSSYFSLWHQKGIFYAFTFNYFIILTLIMVSFLLFLFLYIVLDNNFNNKLSMFWALYFLIGFGIIMPLINGILVSSPASEFWDGDPTYLLQYSFFWIIVGGLYFLTIISLFFIRTKK